MDDDTAWQCVGIALIAGVVACLAAIGLAGSMSVGTCGGTWWGEGDPYAPMTVECVPIGTWCESKVDNASAAEGTVCEGWVRPLDQRGGA